MVNAVKFRKKNIAPFIQINVEKEKDFWKFAIIDKGIGIEKEYSQRIFDIFQRLNIRAEYQGSGIGLAHYEKIVELHGGKIWMEPAPGGGSIFLFTIPEKTVINGK
ncbi:hypothetical protein BH11BAC5_BH11BAC5_55310 [soil metagenome]